MRKMGIDALYRKPNTSRRREGNQIYPYLLRDLPIVRPNQVWSADIKYIPMRRGFAFLIAVLDWYARRVLSWRLSNTLTTGFCLEAVEEAIDRYGRPDIFNTDQGSRFTSLPIRPRNEMAINIHRNLYTRMAERMGRRRKKWYYPVRDQSCLSQEPP